MLPHFPEELQHQPPSDGKASAMQMQEAPEFCGQTLSLHVCLRRKRDGKLVKEEDGNMMHCAWSSFLLCLMTIVN
jgi:hypothetical protein